MLKRMLSFFLMMSITLSISVGSALAYNTEDKTEPLLTYIDADNNVLELGSLGLLDILGDKIIESNTITVHARAYDEAITATNTSDPSESGTIYGTYYYITQEGYEGLEEKEGFTHLDWGDPLFGSRLFYAAVGVEYTPTSWVDGGY